MGSKAPAASRGGLAAPGRKFRRASLLCARRLHHQLGSVRCCTMLTPLPVRRRDPGRPGRPLHAGRARFKLGQGGRALAGGACPTTATTPPSAGYRDFAQLRSDPDLEALRVRLPGLAPEGAAPLPPACPMLCAACPARLADAAMPGQQTGVRSNGPGRASRLVLARLPSPKHRLLSPCRFFCRAAGRSPL